MSSLKKFKNIRQYLFSGRTAVKMLIPDNVTSNYSSHTSRNSEITIDG
jgi:hypothetical protein